jgi:hypothetical protein
MKPGRSNGLDRLDVPNEYAVRREVVPRISLVTRGNGGCSALTRRNVFDSIKRLPLLAKGRSSGWTAPPDVQALLNGSYDRELEDLTDEAVVGFSSR